MKNRKLSKFLSLILRHRPEVIGIALDKEGWASTEELIAKLQEKDKEVDLATIQEVVRSCDKQRFKLSPDNRKIRANQGHSVAIELGLPAITPPLFLYHGTAIKNKASILKVGLNKRKRQHVHLSADKETAIKVGKRHGKPFVFVIDTGKMHKAGIPFYQAENGVWLTDHVAPEFIYEK